ncbi:hypothetical protein AAY473_037239 [Plecturocebus cupreus]
MACSFTQSMTQSTVAQQSSQEPTVLQARQPEAKPGLPQGCQEMHFNTNERPQQAIRHNRGASSMGNSISSGGDLETLPQQVSPHNHVASSIKSSMSSGGDLETLAQQAVQCNCVVAAYISNKYIETLTQQALQHDLMASFFTQSTVAKHSSQESTVHQAGQPDAVLAPPSCQEMHFNTNERLQRALRHNHCWGFRNLASASSPRVTGVASSIKSSSSSCGDLQTLAQQGLQCNCVVPAYIGNEDLETLTLQALQHNLMASSLTQRTTQSTVAQQSSQEATVLQARRPEAELAWPSSSWGCRKAARRPQQALPHNHMASSIKSSSSSGGDLETLAQQALLRNCVACSIRSSTSSGGDLENLPEQLLCNRVASSVKSSTSSVGDLETLAQQALQCNCVVTACIGNKDLETLTLQALRMTSWRPPSPRAPSRAPWLNNHHRQPPSSKLGSPRLCWPGQLEAGAAAGLPGDAFQY